jgi:hypothetical protein
LAELPATKDMKGMLSPYSDNRDGVQAARHAEQKAKFQSTKRLYAKREGKKKGEG